MEFLEIRLPLRLQGEERVLSSILALGYHTQWKKYRLYGLHQQAITVDILDLRLGLQDGSAGVTPSGLMLSLLLEECT